MKKSVRLALAVLTVAAFFAFRHWRGDSATPAAAQGGFTRPPDATAFRAGRLEFKACELAQPRSAATTAAFCAPFEVPENWDAPATSRKIALRLALIASDGAVAERDLVVLLAGGPGQSAIDSWPQVAAAFAPLLRHRNVLLLDQRGTGGSHALACKDSPDPDQAVRSGGLDLWKIKAATRACLDQVSLAADPAQYTTGAALRDLEAVRQALGAPQLDLVGVSYGTRVAQQYLRRYPDAVRSVVLDSAVPNELVLGSEFAIDLDAALKAQFALCTHTPACAAAFGDPYARLYTLRDALRENPPGVSFRHPRSNALENRRLDAYTLAQVVRLFAYSAETSALLPLAIDRALKGDYASLLGQADLLEDELGELAGSGMQLSVICAEDADRLVDRPQDAQLILGDTLVRAFRAQCEVWPHGTRSADFHAPITSDKPVLILGGEFDPVTPPRYAQQILKGLPNGRVLVAKGQGHGVMGRGCFPRLVERFVETLDAKHLDAGCIADFGPTPAFIDFNGAGP